jgi:hypothetical protein
MTRTLAVNKIIALVFVFFVGPYISGCNPAKSDLAVFNCQFEAADYNRAGLFAQKKIKNGKNPSGDDLLWTLQLASAERMQLNHGQAIASFDKAEEMFNYYAPQSEIVDAVGSTIVNDNVVPYKGAEYDGVMVNTYKALDFLAENNLDLARVEFNRALERQTRAKEHFAAEIRKLETQLDNQKKKTSSDARAMANDPNIMKIVNANYPNIDQFQPYPDFVNPAATYLAGLYFCLVGDYDKAGYLLKETSGMVPDNTFIAEDLVLNDDVIAGKVKLENMVWVVFENGLGPVKEEIRIDLPLFLASSRVYYTGIALPRLQPRSIAYSCLYIKTEAGTYQTKQVADMERVIQTEFQKEFGGILTRAIASAVIKAAAQYAVSNQNRNNNELAGALATAMVGLYSYATTAADVRIWSALPKEFQVARCAIPADRKLQICPDGGVPFEVNIPSCKNAIVYVRIVRTGALPMYEVLAF